MTAPNPHAIAPAEAARFLAQAAFGGGPAAVAEVQRLGFDGWLQAQFQEPPGTPHVEWLLANGYGVEDRRNSFAGLENTLWRQLLSGRDALRQRMALALSEVLVVSMEGLSVAWRALSVAAYQDLLLRHAFGSFRTLLEAVTLSPAMGDYLDMRGNQKADGKGRQPDENYAREVMQLFTLGLVELQPDGTPRLRDGQGVETYTPEDVQGLARVFTGWTYDNFSRRVPDHVLRPMVFDPSRHEPGPKRFLGVTVPAGTPGPEALAKALDTLCAHPNVGPFIGRQLIQRLVSSNPSPGYVRRVAAAFDGDGKGPRGDLRAVLRAVLLDPEARAAPQAQAGRLREPLERFVQWARTFGATAQQDQWNVGNTGNPATRLGQSPLRAPSVFNFFRPGYVPPGTALALSGRVAPEFQITHESSVVGYVNWMQQVVTQGVSDVKADYEPWLPLARQPAELVEALDTLLAAGRLGDSTRALIAEAVADVPAAQPLRRVQAAVWLVFCSPAYLVAA